MRRYDTGRRPSPRAVAVVAVVLAVLIGTAVWLLGSGDPTDSPDGSRSGQPTAATPDISREAPTTAPPDGVVLPEGTDQVDGHPTGFPASDLGPVAVQVAIARAQVGFDYDQAAHVASIYAAPDTRKVLEERSRAAVTQRREQAGVPDTGEVPAPVSYAVTPIAFTVAELDSGTWAVSLLSYVSLTDVEGTIGDFLYSGTQLFSWIDEDWKVVQGTKADIDELTAAGQPAAAAPGTPEYEDAGWIGIRGEYQ
ncbi:hypothetical protein BSP109_02207 [Brevibacterium sp. Mu109]|uniref:hypothetical protein n=1 Tax=Brevibacterium sp. Mu109 TaxID=1255669 RepID=UPI000C3AB743|nr:hypothetical protein [Brevibacterium sp. Mu109]SMX87365.1 hypothetical protein BSP109_02207 [Brevibacterium sp. Mu109]